MSAALDQNATPSCPCCLFTTDDLFLPRSEKKEVLVNKARTGHGADEEALAVGAAPLSPRECWETLQEQQMLSDTTTLPLLVDTHGHAHLKREEPSSSSSSIYALPPSSSSSSTPATSPNNNDDQVVSLTCSVHPSDWQACLEYAAASPHRMAALGVHPWYLANLDEGWLTNLEVLMQTHPGCMIGEIGLCKMARFVRTFAAGKAAALELQRHVFVQQLRLAARYQRPVSIHCVNQQGVLLDIFQQEFKSSSSSGSTTGLLPAMALHSFSGTAHQIQQLLQWEESLKLPISGRPLLYFGFSHAVNCAMSTSDKARRQGREAIRAVPPNRLLAESDVHCQEHVAVGTAGAVAYIAWALGEESVERIAARTRRNGLHFLNRLHHGSTRQETNQN